MSESIVVLTTTEHEEEAQGIAKRLVDARLAACVQIVGPITSTYRWQGKVCTSREWQCVIKTRRDQFEAIEQAIRKVHTYDVPEIIALPILVGSSDYLGWIADEVGPRPHE